MMTEMKVGIGARLNRLEARQLGIDEDSVASACRSTYRTYAKARTGHGRSMAMASFEEKATPSLAQQNAAGFRQERAVGANEGIGIHPQNPHEAAYRRPEARTYFATMRVLRIRDVKLAIEEFEGKEVYPGIGAEFGPWGKRFLRQVRIAKELSKCLWTEDI